MANYSSLLAAVNAAITANGTGAITGPVLNTVLQQMIVSLGQGGYIFKGRAIPTTDPGSPDQNVFYIATTPGTYTNFSSIVVAAGECAILKGSGTSWSKEATGIDLVSVSQNSSTGHTDINIGSDSYPVASVEEVYNHLDNTNETIGLIDKNVLARDGYVSGLYISPEGEILSGSNTMIAYYNIIEDIEIEVNIETTNYLRKDCVIGIIDSVSNIMDGNFLSPVLFTGVQAPDDNTQIAGYARVKAHTGDIICVCKNTARTDYEIKKISNNIIQYVFTEKISALEEGISTNGEKIEEISEGVDGELFVSEPKSSVATFFDCSIKKGEHYRIKIDASNGWNRIIINMNNNSTENRIIDSSDDRIEGIWIDIYAKKDITKLILSYISATDSSITLSAYIGGILNDGKKDNVLNGKVLVACGDSFTEYTAARGGSTEKTDDNWDNTWQVYKTYPYWIAQRNGMLLVNKAVSGMTMTALTNNSFSLQYGRYTQLPDNADYIIFKFGINDDAAHQNAPIGTIDDATNQTFYGAWNIVLDYITTNYPNAKLGIIITNGADTEDLTKSIPYMEATIAIAKKWGIGYLNEGLGEEIPVCFRTGRVGVSATMRNRILDRYKISQYDMHPCVEWHEYESTIVEAWLRTL